MTTELLKNHTLEQWQTAAARELETPETRLFIDGDYVDAVDGGRFDSVNPANREVIATVSAANTKDVDRAVAAARSAFRGGTWSRMAPRDRMAVLYRFANLIDLNAERLAVLDTLDMGKPITDMVRVDIPAAVETVQFMAEYIDKMEGSVTHTASDVMHYVLREPIGVIAAISPWNYPLLMAIWKVAPALAAGNTIVLKPAEQAPLSCLRLAELFVEAGGPPGVFNVINGIGEVAGKALALHNDVDKVTFTGSTEVGKLMLQYAGQSNMKRVSLECGGKSPQIFMADTQSMKHAIRAAYHGIYANMGEVCNAGSRILVEKSIYDEFVERFVKEGKDAYVAGDPLDPETNLGPLVTDEAQQRVLSFIESGKSEGAKLRFGGDAPDLNGSYVNPTLFTDVNNDMRIAREEIFGPVASILRFEGIEQAIEIANDTIYGLAAGVWTSDLNTAHRLIKGIEAGVIWVNSFDAGDMTQPFGGYKQSGNARDKCVESILSYTQSKSAWIRLSG
jgi:acyl-CoA reductase-like NAD-dependent aldehyde dehydrogenase